MEHSFSTKKKLINITNLIWPKFNNRIKTNDSFFFWVFDNSLFKHRTGPTLKRENSIRLYRDGPNQLITLDRI